MNNKFLATSFVVIIALIGLMTAQVAVLKRQPVPPVATTTPPVATPEPQPATPSPQPVTAPKPTLAFVATQTAERVVSTQVFEGWRKYSFPSLDNNYSFDIYFDAGSNNCVSQIADKEGHEYNTQTLLNGNGIGCSDDPEYYRLFIGWLGGDKLVLHDDSGNIKIIDAQQFSATAYQYDSNNLIFRGVGNSLKYWLFQKGPEGPYVLFDKVNNAVALEIPNDYLRGALYDGVNDGFVFMGGGSVTTSTVTVWIDFLSLRDLKLKRVLKTEPAPERSIGCSSESLHSKLGEIILSPGCLTVLKKYLGPDGNIHIKL